MSRWVIVQSIEQVELGVDEFGKGSDEVKYLSTEPNSYYDLVRRSIQPRSIHSYVNRDRLNALAVRNAKLSREITDRLDQLLHNSAPTIPDRFRPFDALQYQLKHTIDSVTFSFEELTGFLRTEQPLEIVYWSRPVYTGTHKNSFASQGTTSSFRLFSDTIINQISNQPGFWTQTGAKPIMHEIPPDAGIAASENGIKLGNFIGINPNLIYGLKLLGLGLMTNIIKRRQGTYLVVSVADNSASFLKWALKEHKIRIHWWTDFSKMPIDLVSLRPVKLSEDVLESEANTLTNDVLKTFNSESWEEHLQHHIIGKIIKRKLRQFVREKLDYLLNLYQFALSYFKMYRPRAVICGTNDREETQIIRQAAASQGIPFIVFQHGGGQGYLRFDSLLMSDLKSDFYVAYGYSGAQTLQAEAERAGLPTQVVPSGWSSAEKIAKICSKKQSRNNEISEVVYVPTGLVGDLRYGPYHDDHDTRYCIHQMEVVDALSRLQDIPVIVKFHYKDKIKNPLAQDVIRAQYPQINIQTSSRLIDILPSASVVVLDCPTTTLLEAMAAGKHVIYLHTGIFQWTSQGEDQMRKSAIWIELTPGWKDLLCRQIYKLLCTPAIPPKENIFLQHYAHIDFQPERLWKAIGE